jgi:hypothetical protein
MMGYVVAQLMRYGKAPEKVSRVVLLAQLGGLSERLGLCRRDAVRLAILRLLENPDEILGLRNQTDAIPGI